jgi:hypothetical protein
MIYQKWRNAGKKGAIFKLNVTTNSSLLRNVEESEWIDFVSNEFKKRVQEKCSRLYYLDQWEDGYNQSDPRENACKEGEPAIGKEKEHATIEKKT